MKKLFLGALVALVSTSCATIFSGTRATIVLTSPDARNVDLTVDNTQYGTVTLPTQIEVRRGFSPSLIVARTENREGITTVHKTFNPIALLNILLGGVPGAIIDCATGAVTKPEMDTYIIQLNHRIAPVEEIVIPYRPGEAI